jgi:hypothetical protein
MNKKEAKFEKFIKKQLNTNTMSLSLLQVDDNNYIIFGKYTITKGNNCYVVRVEDYGKEHTFSNLKTAVTWCVFNKKKKTIECKKIENLDFKIASLDIDIVQKTKVLNSLKDEGYKYVYISKIEEDQMKKKILLNQLNKFINTSKDWQTRKFNEAKSKDKR